VPAGESNQSIVNGFDRRTQTLATAEWPNSVHGVIKFQIKNISEWGTGILIGPNILLTAGHNLYCHRRKAYAELESLRFLPAIDGQVLPFGDVEVGHYLVSPNYIKEGKEDHDILVLKEPIGDLTDYFDINCLEPEEKK